MRLEGTYTFEAPRELVWQSLHDPEILAKVMPGCKKLEQVGENEYEGVLKIKVGPVQGTFKGLVHITNMNKPESYNMSVDGKGAPGFMKGEGEVRLEADGESSTIMHYGGDAQVGGRIASVGQRLLDSSAKAITRQSLESLNKQILAQLEAQNEPESAPEAETVTPSATANGATPKVSTPKIETVEAEAPSQTEFAMGVAKEVFNDLVPKEKQPLVFAAGAGLVLFMLYLLLRRK